VVGHFYFRGKCEQQPTAKNLGKFQGRSAQGKDIQPVLNPGHPVWCKLSQTAQLRQLPLMMNAKRYSQVAYFLHYTDLTGKLAIYLLSIN